MAQPARRFTLPSPLQGRGKPEDSRSLGEGEGRGRVVAHRPGWSGPRRVELGELLANPPELRPYLLVVVQVREVREVAFTVSQSPLEVAKDAPGDPAIEPLASRLRGQNQDPVDDGHDL